MIHYKPRLSIFFIPFFIALFIACSPTPAMVKIKFDIAGGDNTFAATIYAQDISTGETYSKPYDPHTPYIIMNLKNPGKFVFYARLVEVPDDYYYGFTGYQSVGYGHMTRGGVGKPEGLAALTITMGNSYNVYINDSRVNLPEKGKPVVVPWFEIKNEKR